MSSDDDTPEKPATPALSEDRPLDALFPELGGGAAAFEAHIPLGADVPAIHPGVVTVELEHGREWLLVAWRDPGGAIELRRAVGTLVEASFLWAMTQPPGTPAENLRALELFVFAPIEELARPMQTLGFRPVPYNAEANRGRMSALRDEAEQAGFRAPSRPTTVWRAELARPDAALVERMLAVEDRLAAALGDERWGEQPGSYSKELADALGDVFGVAITPDLDGLEQMDVLLVERREGVTRWMPPLIFQALCDFVGVVLQASGRAQVQWAITSAAAGGVPQPPALRVHARGRIIDMPVARRLVHWLVLPLLPGMKASLRERFEGEFASLGLGSDPGDGNASSTGSSQGSGEGPA